MKKTSALFTLIASMLIAFTAQAAGTADLSVKGVIRPVACDPSLSSGGVVDYGTIDAAQIPANQPTWLGVKNISFTITCSGPVPIALRLIDNRTDSVVRGLFDSPDETLQYGLGTVDEKKIGSYLVLLGQVKGVPATGEAMAPVNVLSGSNNSAWTTAGRDHFSPDGSVWKGFTSSGNTGVTPPLGYLSLTGNLVIHSAIDQGSNLPLAQDVGLDGSATLEIMYL